MADIEGIEDLRVDAVTGLPQLRVAIDRHAVARTGLTPGDVVRALRIGLVGDEVSEVWVGQKRYDLVVRLADTARNSVVGDPQSAAGGARRDAQSRSSRSPASRKCWPRAPSAAKAATDAWPSKRAWRAAIWEVLPPRCANAWRQVLQLPAGYFVEVGGRVEQQERARQSLTIAIVAALIAVFALLYLALGSFAETGVILATLPSAFVGGIVALLIAGETWNVSSLVGLIGLFGIAVQNSLVLVAQTRDLVAEGHPFRDALREASIGRVRPKLMTAMTAILGLLPLLVLNMHGTEIERPLAIVMIGGLVTSTLFTLLALPTFYLFVHESGERWRRFRAA